jgi:DNA protecting protein DprA
MEFPIRQFAADEIRWQISSPPTSVYVQGTPEAFTLLDKLPERGLAVVGTRRPQARAELFVRRTILDLRNNDLIILSGLARGIDTCAHEAALEADLPTVAILGCGLNHQYPRENEELRQTILEHGGLVITEYEPSELPKPHYFLCRNRLIAGLSKATWIAQAPFRSGALNTAFWARVEHRDCYATPSFPDDPALAGNQKLLDDHEGIPVWEAHCFDKTWPELASIQSGKNRSEKKGDALLNRLRHCTASSGGATTADLLDWAMAQGLSPLDFFERLQKAQQSGLVSERNGVLASS